MKIANRGTVLSLSAIAIPLGLAGRSMLHLMPWVGWMLLVLTALYLLLAIEFALGTPVIDRWSARCATRRAAAREADRIRDRISYEAAAEAGLEVTRAYVRERNRKRQLTHG